MPTQKNERGIVEGERGRNGSNQEKVERERQKRITLYHEYPKEPRVRYPMIQVFRDRRQQRHIPLEPEDE